MKFVMQLQDQIIQPKEQAMQQQACMEALKAEIVRLSLVLHQYFGFGVTQPQIQ